MSRERPPHGEPLLEAERAVGVPLAEVAAVIGDAVGVRVRLDLAERTQGAPVAHCSQAQANVGGAATDRDPRAIEAQAQALGGAARRKPDARGLYPVLPGGRCECLR